MIVLTIDVPGSHITTCCTCISAYVTHKESRILKNILPHTQTFPLPHNAQTPSSPLFEHLNISKQEHTDVFLQTKSRKQTQNHINYILPLDTKEYNGQFG